MAHGSWFLARYVLFLKYYALRLYAQDKGSAMCFSQDAKRFCTRRALPERRPTVIASSVSALPDDCGVRGSEVLDLWHE